MDFFFWQNIPSIHQSALLCALAQKTDCNVTLIVPEDISEHRKSMGWTVPDFGDTKVIIAPSPPEVDSLISNLTISSIHVFSGFRSYPFVQKAMRKIMRKRHIVGVFTESPDHRGLKGRLRYFIYKYQSQQYKRHIDFILATGETAMSWYYRCGYSSQLIFPFGYFIDPPSKLSILPHTSTSRINIIYIGSLIHLKAVDTLIQALSAVKNDNWKLSIIGDGPERKALEDQANEAELRKKVKFHGNLANVEALKNLNKSDFLVLPSRYDGWGAVVNEALMVGVPVLCSDQCGAASLLDGKDRGTIFIADSVAALTKHLDVWINKGPQLPKQKDKLIRWSTEHISGPVAANYLVEIACYITNKGPKPTTPWSSTKDPVI